MSKVILLFLYIIFSVVFSKVVTKEHLKRTYTGTYVKGKFIAKERGEKKTSHHP